MSAERQGATSWRRIGTLVALYVAQGIPWGFTASTLPAYIAARGVSAAALSDAFVATTLPYSFKWVWGPIVDAVRLPGGRRRPWILLAQLLMALTIGAMLLAGDLDKDLGFLATLVLVHTVFNALQDVATDGLAVDLLEENERGRVNGLLFAAKYGGGVIGGAGLANVIAVSSLQVALVVQAAILLVIMLAPLLVTEPARVDEEHREGVLRALAASLGTRKAFGLALCALVFTFAQGTLAVISGVLFTQELHWSPEKLANLTGGWGLGAGLAGSLLGGAIADRLGHRRVTVAACGALAAGWLLFALGEPWWTSDAFVYVLSLWETFVYAVGMVSMIALCMGVVSRTAAATQFAAYMALSNFSTTLGYSVPSWIPSGWSPRDFYFTATGIQLACALMFVLIEPVRPETPSVRRGYAAIALLGALLVTLTTFVVWRKLS